MAKLCSFLKKHWLAIALAVLCAVLAVFLVQARQVARLDRQERLDRLVAAHGQLAAALEGDTLSSQAQMRAAGQCRVLSQRLADLDQQDSSDSLARFYASAERYLTDVLTARYQDLPRGEDITLTAKDRSVVDFLRQSCLRVYEEDPETLEDVYAAIGSTFEDTFHSFDQDDFFRHDDPLEAFFGD